MSFQLEACYLVSGQPHPLLARDKSSAWNSLANQFEKIGEEIEMIQPELILYFSTQWLSVLGWMFQADPKPSFVHVDPNWHEFGSMPYEFSVDEEFAKIHAEYVALTGRQTRTVNYQGFPIDTGTIVAQKFLNPKNQFKASMISCNMYAEKSETMAVGEMSRRALEAYGKRTVVVLVSNLSNRYFVEEIDPEEDRISSLKDDEWNQKICELLGEGRLEDVAQVAREFAKEANGDMQFKGIWWLNALCGESNEFKGKVFDYQPVWGTGCALVGLYPKESRATLPSQGQAPVALEVNKDHTGIDSIKAALPVGPYPHAREEGDFLLLSGIGPRRRGNDEIPGLKLDQNGAVISYDIEAETHGVFDNIKAVLESAGLSLQDIVDIQVFLTNMESDFKSFNKVYGEYFTNPSNAPTRTTVGIHSLPTPIHVEFKVMARKKVCEDYGK